MNQDSSYNLCSINEEEKLQEWADFCASCFAYKANAPPASYFLSHFFNDPRRDASLVTVMKESSSLKIVASTRVFVRRISIGNGKSVEAGGIGEVCTSLDHRKKGLAKKLLLNAIQLMTDRNMNCSMLHASPSLMNVYERNYKGVDSHWTILPLDSKYFETEENALLERGNHLNVRLASFPNDTMELKTMHESYSQERFCGCIIRTTEYWNEYIRHEIGDSLFVLTDQEKILAWMSIQQRSETRLRLREFGWCMENDVSVNIQDAFSCLIMTCMNSLMKEKGVVPESLFKQDMELAIPSLVYKDLTADCEENTSFPFMNQSLEVKNECDPGWMYKDLLDNDLVDMSNVVNVLKVHHLIWPSDSF
ncbi:hypothetical protein CTEN210_06790 [Chaetoceros tenuissimus]|uniref:N-acetyltransferase domain-containing protein n=1 Tax=Chaetoceros tenuissimus TaxID=426638 RepID=A0AAD3H559_9STRA|nr:hypothetical protein CTEN210_06790 [Chaetoceros tenuissimus]